MIFQENHPGIQINATEVLVVEILTLNPTTLKGYFSRENLEAILAQPECVAIRLYNLYNQQNPQEPIDLNAGLIACGVNENGFEIENGLYLQSPHPSSIDHPATINNSSRSLNQSFFTIRGVAGEIQEPFVSVWSKMMIQTLLDSPGADGVCFYKYSLVDAANPPMITFNSALNTHIAIPSKPNLDGSIPQGPTPDSQGFIPHLISDQPCPGHCATRMVLDSGEEIFSVSTTPVDDDPYLFAWH